ncbi:hypothetical protein GCG54_00009274 [Colletotrichum gloeosporioides]|uniref:Uncharacterized protein n=1 Tax=Colletotrichum gloeosporioides TaxID=474922 RepID=A0A8H4C565_COLGL|nr:uncharacterized protein GCG54_00009274 [Colletotrichum gloeosporioides]KAF3797303.1 hypothetical protein GCG54_00009274 [Colletotrichum gloeosporioides]
MDLENSKSTYLENDGPRLYDRNMPIYSRAGGSTLKSLPSDNQRPSTFASPQLPPLSVGL